VQNLSYLEQGLDTPTPFLQLSGTILKGRHQQLLGTEFLFLEGKGSSALTLNPQQLIRVQTMLIRRKTLVGTTEQRIKFVPVEVVPKGEAPTQPTESEAKERKAKKQERLIDWTLGKIADPPRRTRSKKGKERAQDPDDEQAMDVEQDLPRRSSRPRKATKKAARETSPLEYAEEPTAMDIEEG
jgi:general transcription factor 3C polypeptide 6